MRRIRQHLTYANVMVTILAFVVLGGGTALAAYVVSSNSQIGPGTVSGHKPPNGKHANIIAGSITGQDIARFSGVDRCTTPLTAKLGRICAGSDGVERTFSNALNYCSGFGLHLPSVSEAVTLAKNYAVPGVSSNRYFWTDDEYVSGGIRWTVVVRGDGISTSADQTGTDIETVCVAYPTN
jgi:hypothetical protein